MRCSLASNGRSLNWSGKMVSAPPHWQNSRRRGMTAEGSKTSRSLKSEWMLWKLGHVCILCQNILITREKKSKNEIRIWLFCNRDERWESCDSCWLTEVVTLCYHIFLSLINKDVIVHHDVSLKTSSHAIPADINSNPIFRCKICKSLNLQPRLTRAQATLFTPAVRLL